MWWAWKGRVRRYLLGSLWIVPALFGIAGAFLSSGLLSLDESADIAIARYDIGTSTALLTAFIGAMVSFTGFVLTMVTFVVQFATSQLTTRILLFTYRDWRLKVILGLFVGSMVYSFILLSRMRGDTIPNLSVVVAGVFVLLSILAFLWYLSHFTSSIRPATAATSIARYGRAVVAQSYPSSFRPGDVLNNSRDAMDATLPIQVLSSDKTGGAILAINEQGLIQAARQVNGVLRLRYAIGDYVRQDAAVITVHGPQRLPGRISVDRLVQIGPERTFEQDPAYAIRILADIALKALSAAINDPTTAVNAIDRIGDLLALIGQHDQKLPGAAGNRTCNED